MCPPHATKIALHTGYRQFTIHNKQFIFITHPVQLEINIYISCTNTHAVMQVRTNTHKHARTHALEIIYQTE